MLTTLVLLSVVLVVLVIAGAAYVAFQREADLRTDLAEAVAKGMNQPPSLHPVIAHDICIGSSSCVDACPESVLGRVDGLTQMVQAANCIGHGRCHASCPVGAIALVFGSAERGVDIPLLRAGYESNVDGLFIVGELGGMGLIRNAMRQGMRAVQSIPEVLERAGVTSSDEADVVDVVIVGAGPAGIATAIQCVDQGVSFALLEQFTLGGSVTHYPRRKLVFTEQIKLPRVGKFGKSEMLKDELIAEFERVLLACGIEILEHRRVSAVQGAVGDFRVQCETEGGVTEVHRGRTVVLAIGRRGTPRRLGVPGEDLPHVVYRLIDAEQYRRRRVLCVGGGDSSVETAVSLAHIAGCEVHLSYRGKAFFRVKKKNRDDLDEVVEAGKVQLHMETTVASITPETVTLTAEQGPVTLEVDDLIVNVGGILPTPFLESIGVCVETKHGEVALAPEHGKFAKRSSSRHSTRSDRPPKASS